MPHSGRRIDRPGARVNSSRLRNAGTSEKGHALDDDDLPRRQGGALAALTREPLDPLSVDELDDRIAALEAELARVKAPKAAATSHKEVAEERTNVVQGKSGAVRLDLSDRRNIKQNTCRR